MSAVSDKVVRVRYIYMYGVSMYEIRVSFYEDPFGV